jgi:MinD-like ATPase involved in chromosome partitioning or flagellar assembly
VIGVLLAVPEHPQEQDLVAGASGSSLRILRRCLDGVDLLAAAAVEPGAAVVVSAGLPRLSTDIADRLALEPGRVVIGLAGSDADAALLDRLGVTRVVRSGPNAAATLQHLAGALAAEDGRGPDSGVWSTGCWTDGGTESAPLPPSDVAAPTGRLVAVWGPMGAPGRTTVAIGVAEALADSGRRVCLVDADTYAPSVTLALGLVGETGGLLAACRHADNGSLTAGVLLSAACRVRGSWHVLAGLPAADRWPELRSGALERVWAACRSAADVTVVDVGFCLEDDDSAGAWSRRRNAAALTALAAADHVLAVADAAPQGAARIAAAWPLLRARTGGANVTVVRNRARGRDRGWQEAVLACGVSAPLHPVPADESTLAACWIGGRSLGEGAPRSRIRRALVEVGELAVSG